MQITKAQSGRSWPRVARFLWAPALLPLLFSCTWEGGLQLLPNAQAKSATVKKGKPPIVPVTADKLHKIIEQTKARAVLVDIWATYCVPCRAEFPLLLKLYKKYRSQGLALILVSADFPAQLEDARKFLQDQGVDFKTYIKSGKDDEFINGVDERWSGALPVNLIYSSPKKKVVHFWEGETIEEEFEKKIKSVLNKKNKKQSKGGER